MGLALLFLGFVQAAWASGDAPSWMHALVNVPLPAHDEKTEAVVLYADDIVSVHSADKIRTTVRRVYKILRPNGRGYGMVRIPFDSRTKISNLHGWCIPAQGKDYEVKDRDAVDTSLLSPEFVLYSDDRTKLLNIPAADPGNIVGYEYELEEQPYALQSLWSFQHAIPVREAHFRLELPVGWHYRATFLNARDIKPDESGNQLQWSISDVNAIRPEEQMPPWQGIAGRMIVNYFPEGGVAGKTFSNWTEYGLWAADLRRGRESLSPEAKEKVDALTHGVHNPVVEMREIATFIQREIRYVAIALGIGGWQPHPAQEVFTYKYGDCKDKALLTRTMLHEIGIDSYDVVINTERGSVGPGTPAYLGSFNHVITAIKLPSGVNDPSLLATIQHPRLGTLLFFDPTSELTPFGQIPGYLQANYGLLVAPDGGELIKLPQQPSKMNGIQRIAKLSLTPTGALTGDVKETRLGDRAVSERWRLRTVTKDADRIKPIEALLASSLSNFQITKASVLNVSHTDMPFGFEYSFRCENYAKNAGNLLLLRPRVIGIKGSGILETKEPRRFPVEFEGPVQDTDDFEIAIPAGYEVDDLPPPIDSEYSFASYHSKTEVRGNAIRYTRTFEVKELSVPVEKAEDLKKFYRIVAGDERNTAVLKLAAR